MYSLSPGRSRGRDGGNGSISKVGLKGLFSDGIWQCNCEPRMPAAHFQTKNGGPNHGKWFYTCQKPQPQRCNFFLWAEEAQHREATTVMNNSRSEIQTPTRQPDRGALTPSLGWVKIGNPQFKTPDTPSKPPRNPQPNAGLDGESDEEEFFDWPNNGDEEIAQAIEKAVEKVSMPPPETPRKAIKTSILSTPGTPKRNFSQIAYPTPSKDTDDVFNTPSTSLKGRSLFPTAALPSPEVTPTTQRARAEVGPELTNEVIDCLQNAHVGLNIDVIASVKEICKRHTLRAEGFVKGRDISRAALAAEKDKVVELQNRIAALQEEKETLNIAIRQLKRDLREATACDSDLYT